MNKQPFHLQAETLIDEQITLSEQLIVLLERENAELRTLHVQDLEKLSEEKHALVSALNISSSRWQALIALENIQPDTKSLATFLALADRENESNLLQSWQRLLDLAKQCQRLNAINGTIMVLRNQAVQQTLSILRGQFPRDQLYDTNGNQRSTYSGGQEIAKA